MRIVAWNCQMAFRRKFQTLADFDPDILVISECESPAFLASKNAHLPWPNHVWMGENPAKGISVFSKQGINLRMKRNHRRDLRFVVPVSVTGPELSFDLLALWTQAEKPQSAGYVTHALNAVKHYGKRLSQDALLLGDFNSSTVFKHSGGRHVEMVKRLQRRGFTSLYHDQSRELHGQESRPTFYLHRDTSKPYHLDYIFCQSTRTANIAIGKPENWLHLSDHMPLMATISKSRQPHQQQN